MADKVDCLPPFLYKERREKMIECKLNNTKKQFELIHDMQCREHIADELALLLDVIIADYEVKTSRKCMNCSLEEKEQIVVSERNRVLEIIIQKECTCKKYLQNSDISIRKLD